MSGHKLLSGRDLGLAICKHFGIDTAKHVVDSDFEIKTEPGKPVTVKLTFMLTADDLAGIARAAGGDRDEAKVSIDAQSSEILRRYGATEHADDDCKVVDAISQLVEESRKMRECLYQIVKNTKRSVDIAEDTAASVGANAATVVQAYP